MDLSVIRDSHTAVARGPCLVLCVVFVLREFFLVPIIISIRAGFLPAVVVPGVTAAFPPRRRPCAASAFFFF